MYTIVNCVAVDKPFINTATLNGSFFNSKLSATLHLLGAFFLGKSLHICDTFYRSHSNAYLHTSFNQNCFHKGLFVLCSTVIYTYLADRPQSSWDPIHSSEAFMPKQRSKVFFVNFNKKLSNIFQP